MAVYKAVKLDSLLVLVSVEGYLRVAYIGGFGCNEMI